MGNFDYLGAKQAGYNDEEIYQFIHGQSAQLETPTQKPDLVKDLVGGLSNIGKQIGKSYDESYNPQNPQFNTTQGVAGRTLIPGLPFLGQMLSKNYLYNPETKRIAPASIEWDYVDLSKLDPNSKEYKEKEKQIMMSMIMSLSGAPETTGGEVIAPLTNKVIQEGEIVGQKALAAPETLGIQKSIPQPLDDILQAGRKAEQVNPLFEEAKKYKSPEEFVSATNPTNKQILPSQRPTIYKADIEGITPSIKPYKKVGELQFINDKGNGIYVKVNGEDAGYLTKLNDNEVDLSVAKEFQGKGIGKKLVGEFLNNYPEMLYKTGGFTPAGEATYKSQLTDIWNQAQGVQKINSIKQTENSLLDEARKYKTPEEFIDATRMKEKDKLGNVVSVDTETEAPKGIEPFTGDEVTIKELEDKKLDVDKEMSYASDDEIDGLIEDYKAYSDAITKAYDNIKPDYKYVDEWLAKNKDWLGNAYDDVVELINENMDTHGTAWKALIESHTNEDAESIIKAMETASGRHLTTNYDDISKKGLSDDMVKQIRKESNQQADIGDVLSKRHTSSNFLSGVWNQAHKNLPK